MSQSSLSAAALLQQRLLSLPQPGQGLRFVFEFRGDGRIRTAIEGIGENQAALRVQAGLELEAARQSGFVFEPARVPSAGGRKRGKVAPAASDQPDLWLRIRPQTRSLAFQDRDGRLGFQSLAGGQPRLDQVLPVPDLLDSEAPDADNLTALPALARTLAGVRALEFTFMHRALSRAGAEITRRLLDSERKQRLDYLGTESTPGLIEHFLYRWSRHGRGWDLDLTARLAADADLELVRGALTLLGRQVFAAECETMDVQASQPAPPGGTMELTASYPQTWPLPALLPNPADPERQAARRAYHLRLPRLPAEGVHIGHADDQPVRLPLAARDRHTYIVGATGTGKSTLLRRLIDADLAGNDALLLIDPHGDLFKEVKAAIPDHRRETLLCIDPSDEPLPGINLLDTPPGFSRNLYAQTVISELLAFFQQTWNVPDAFGPIFEQYFRNSLLLAMLQTRFKPDMFDLERVFINPDYRKSCIESCPDRLVQRFWHMAEQVRGDVELKNMMPYILSKLSPMLQGHLLPRLFCRRDSDFDLDDVLRPGGTLLVNLDKGRIGAQESRLAGMLLTMLILTMGMRRAALPPAQRPVVNVYLDEFQNLVSDNSAAMLSEARKFGLRLTMANQNLDQLDAHHGRQRLLAAILGNVGNLISFRLGVPDTERLKPFLKPFQPEQVQELPNFHAVTRLLDDQGPIGPMVMCTLPPE